MNLSLHNDEADESLKALDEMKENDENEGDHFFDVNAPPVEDLGDDSTGAGKFYIVIFLRFSFLSCSPDPLWDCTLDYLVATVVYLNAQTKIQNLKELQGNFR